MCILWTHDLRKVHFSPGFEIGPGSDTFRIVWNFGSTRFGSERANSVGSLGSAFKIMLVAFGSKRLDLKLHEILRVSEKVRKGPLLFIKFLHFKIDVIDLIFGTQFEASLMINISCLSILLDQSTGVNLKWRKCILINLHSVAQFKWSWNLSGYVSSVRHVNERFVLSIVFILHFTFGLTDSWIGFE